MTEKQQFDYEAFVAYESDLLMLKGEAASLDEAEAKVRKMRLSSIDSSAADQPID